MPLKPLQTKTKISSKAVLAIVSGVIVISAVFVGASVFPKITNNFAGGFMFKGGKSRLLQLQCRLPGDVNSDGFVTCGDAIDIFNYYLQKQVTINKACADINRDGSITPEDAQLVIINNNLNCGFETAYFQFTDAARPQETFVIKLIDTAMIQQARDILNGKETEAIHVQGTIVKESADYNPFPYSEDEDGLWDFHLNPSSIRFFSMAAEVCDARALTIQEKLDEVGGSFLPNNVWCPWNSKLTKEINFN